MKFDRKRGAASNLFDFFLPDSTSTTGAGKTGLTSASAGLIIALKRELASTYTVYSQAGSTIETITTIGTFAAPTATKCRFKEIDATNAAGKYQAMFADVLFDASDASRFISGIVWGATGLVPTPFEIQLEAMDIQDSVRLGLTSLPNAAAEAAGGLYTRGSGAGQINQNANGQVDARAVALSTGVIVAGSFTAGAIDAAAIATDAIGANEFAQAAADKVWSSTTRNLSTGAIVAGTFAAGAIDAAAIATDAIGANEFSQAAADKVWASAARSLTTFGTLVSDVATAVWTAGTRTLTAFGFSVTVGTNNDKTGYALTSGEEDAIVDKVWDEAIAGHLTAGSTGNKLNAASSAGDPWTTALPGAYAAGTAGNILGNRDGFKLASTGLDQVAAPADITGDADARSSFVKMFRALVNRFLNQVTQTASQQTIANDSGATILTQIVSTDGVTQQKGRTS